MTQRSVPFLQSLRQWLNQIEVRDPNVAKQLYKLIPAQCPFAQDLKFMGRTIFHIPPLCKLNPFYDELMGLRFRALCYLVDECGIDIQAFS